LPFEHIYHEEEYQQDDDFYMGMLKAYDELISRYYDKRTGGKRKDRWTEQIAGMLAKHSRMYMKEFVNKNKLDLR